MLGASVQRSKMIQAYPRSVAMVCANDPGNARSLACPQKLSENGGSLGWYTRYSMAFTIESNVFREVRVPAKLSYSMLKPISGVKASGLQWYGKALRIQSTTGLGLYMSTWRRPNPYYREDMSSTSNVSMSSSELLTTHHLSSFLIIYHHVSSFIIIYHHLSSFVIIYHHLSTISYHIPAALRVKIHF